MADYHGYTVPDSPLEEVLARAAISANLNLANLPILEHEGHRYGLEVLLLASNPPTFSVGKATLQNTKPLAVVTLNGTNAEVSLVPQNKKDIQ